MKIHDKVLLIAYYRYSLEINNLITGNKFARFDDIYEETVEYLAEQIKAGCLEGYGKQQIREDTFVDIFRLQHQYLFDKYTLLLFELDGLGIKSDKVEKKLKSFYKSVYNYFIEKGFVNFKYATITEVSAVMFFIFLTAEKGSLVEKIKLLMSEITLDDIANYIFEYLKGETF